jgi:hypothetical protein
MYFLYLNSRSKIPANMSVYCIQLAKSLLLFRLQATQQLPLQRAPVSAEAEAVAVAVAGAEAKKEFY